MWTQLPLGRALRHLLVSIPTACALTACDDDTTVVIASRTTPPEDSGGGGLTVIVSSGGGSAQVAPLQPEPLPSATPAAPALAPEGSAFPTPALGFAGRALAVLMVACGAGLGILRRPGPPERRADREEAAIAPSRADAPSRSDVD